LTTSRYIIRTEEQPTVVEQEPTRIVIRHTNAGAGAQPSVNVYGASRGVATPYAEV
jgi:hypothetical protein